MERQLNWFAGGQLPLSKSGGQSLKNVNRDYLDGDAVEDINTLLKTSELSDRTHTQFRQRKFLRVGPPWSLHVKLRANNLRFSPSLNHGPMLGVTRQPEGLQERPQQKLQKATSINSRA